MEAFNIFLDMLGDLREVQLNMKELKNEFKLPKKNFPKLSKMIHYFKTEFCMRTRNESRTKWHNYDKQLLFWVVCKYCQMHSKYIVASLFKKGQSCMDDNDWHEISRILGVETKILKNKWLVMVKPQVKNSPWTQEEDQILQKLIDPNEKNHNWTQVATSLAEMTHNSSFRNAKQIRERWNNYLNPTLKKSEWEESEDVVLLESVLVNGKKWSQISQIMGCRTESQVKNRYNSISNRLKKTYGDAYPEESLIQMEITSLKGQAPSFQHHILSNNNKSSSQNHMSKLMNPNCSMNRNHQRSHSFKSNMNNNDNIICNVKEESNSSDTLQKLSTTRVDQLYRNTKQSTQSHSTSGGVLSDYISPQYSTNNSFPQISETLFLPDSHQHEIFANSQYLQSKKFLQSPSHRFQIPVPPSHQKHQSTLDGTQIFSNQSDMSDFTASASTTIFQDSNQSTLQQQAQFLQLNQQIFNHDDHLNNNNSNNTNNQIPNFHSFNGTAQQINFLCPPSINNNSNNPINANNSSNNNLFIEDWGFVEQHNNNNNNFNMNNNNQNNGNNNASNNALVTPNNNNNSNNIFYPNSTLDFNQALQGLEQAEIRRGSHFIQESQKQFYPSNSFFAMPTTPHNHPTAALGFYTEEHY